MDLHPQLDLLVAEPALLHHTGLQRMPEAKFALCRQLEGRHRFFQHLFKVTEFDTVMRTIEKMKQRDVRHFWISQATLHPAAVTRDTASIILLNACWCDIDLLHPHPKFKGPLPAGDLTKPQDVERLAALLAIQIEDAGLPPPSHIVSTGGGVCPKWVFDVAIASIDRPRWESVQSEIVRRICAITGRIGETTWSWPVDVKVCDAARILRVVGTINPRWGHRCRIVWESGAQYDFDYLADCVLGYTREDVGQCVQETRQQERRERQARHQGHSQVADSAKLQFDINRRAAFEHGIFTSSSYIKGQMLGEAKRALWAGRLEYGKAIIEARGGVLHRGQRNDLFWPMAAALAHSCTSTEQLKRDLGSMHYEYFRGDGWTRQEAERSAAAVINRLAEGKVYRFKTHTWVRELGSSDGEIRQFGHLLAQGQDPARTIKKLLKNVGRDNNSKIQGLSLEAFKAEVARRRARAAKATNTARRAAAADVRANALQLARDGLTVREIAAAIRKGKSTVGRWIGEAAMQPHG